MNLAMKLEKWALDRKFTWVGNYHTRPFNTYRLFRFERGGFKIGIYLHRFINPDRIECFHTHHANAFRLILTGGYVEETYKPRGTKMWRPGMFGFIHYKFAHRVSWMSTTPTWTIWITGKKKADVELLGEGWTDEDHAAQIDIAKRMG